MTFSNPDIHPQHNPLPSPELPRSERSKFQEATQIFIDTYKVILENPLSLFTEKEDHGGRLQEVLNRFEPIKGERLKVLLELSKFFGVPLSPIGLVTDTTFVVDDFVLQVQGFQKVHEIGGIYLEPEKFSTEALRKTGFWVATTNEAAEKQSELEKLDRQKRAQEPKKEPKYEETMINGKLERVEIVQGYEYKPTYVECPSTPETERSVLGYICHEAMHATTEYFNPKVRELDKVSKTLLHEANSWRVQFAQGESSQEDILKILTTGYLSKSITQEQVAQVENVVALICASKETNYHQELSARFLCCSSVDDFLNPSAETQQKMDQFKTQRSAELEQWLENMEKFSTQ